MYEYIINLLHRVYRKFRKTDWINGVMKVVFSAMFSGIVV